MPRILILTSASGAGHNRVAQALAGALAHWADGAGEITIADPFLGADLPSRITRLYGGAIVRAPWLWGLLYRMTDNRRNAAALAAPLEAAVERQLEGRRPDLIVSVHPLCHGAALRALKRTGFDVPVAVLVTDLMDVHAAWQPPGVSLFLVPTEEAAWQVVAGGHPPERVYSFGLPIDNDFRNGNGDNGHKTWLRRRLGLDPDIPAIMVTGGGAGAGPLEQAARTISRVLPQAQLVITCGTNEVLRRRLQAKGLRGRILGFVDNMAQWMQACDVVVAKAGAVTVGEAVAARRPLLIVSALPGQEKGNLRFVLESAVGTHTPSGPVLARALRTLEAEDYRPAGWLENMARVDRPKAQDHAARLLIEEAVGHA